MKQDEFKNKSNELKEHVQSTATSWRKRYMKWPKDLKIASKVIAGIMLLSIIEYVFLDRSTTSVAIAGGDCHYNGIELKGNVMFVSSFPDFTIEYVDSFGDIDVQIVDSFPSECGEWQIVDSFPDFTVQVVDSFGDLKVKKVDSFPRMN